MNLSPRRPETVAVVVPVYCAQYLKDALVSIAKQTRQPDEVIVVDDGSPDGDVIRDAVDACGCEVTVIRQQNMGAAVARNRGIQAARTDLLAFLDADDLWYAQFLEGQLALLDAHRACSVAYADADIIGDSPLAGRRFMDVTPSHGDVTLRSLLTQECTVLTSTVVARRHAVIRAGLFDPQLRRGQDFDLWVRMAHAGCRFVYRRSVLAARRVHAHNLSGSMTAEIERALAVFEKLRRTLPLEAVESGALDARVVHLRGCLQREVGKTRLALGDYDGARAAFAAASAAIPGWKLAVVRLGLQLAPRMLRRAYVRGSVVAPLSAASPDG